jgi:hypothetical protein
MGFFWIFILEETESEKAFFTIEIPDLSILIRETGAIIVYCNMRISSI